MSEKLENALADAIEKANSGIDAATDFVLSELPEVIQQALTWHAAKGVIVSFIWLLIGLVSLCFTRWSLKHWNAMNEAFKNKEDIAFLTSGKVLTSDLYDLRAAPFVISLIVPAVSFIAICCEMIEVAKILIAPKLWLIEYAAKLAN